MTPISPVFLLQTGIRPAFAVLGERYQTREGEQILLGTAAVESSLKHTRQLGNGPALGYFQMEPFTFRDIMRRLPLRLLDAVEGLSRDGFADPEEMVWNLPLAAAMARMKYRDAKPELPAFDDIEGMQAYHKRYYNSALGATKIGEFVAAWENLIEPHRKELWP